MYKIFINQIKVYLASEKKVSSFEQSRKKVRLTYSGSDELSDILSYLESDHSLKKAYIVGESKKQVWEDFSKLYKIIPAAGGLVYHLDTGKLLFILRKGRWDLPKGKIEKKEAIKTAAIREVVEETGIRAPKLGEQILFRKKKQNTVLHTYKLHGTRVLKSTYWFDMFYRGDDELKPQTEEDIEEVKWVKPQNLSRYLDNSFSSVKDVIKNSPHFNQAYSKL